MIDAMRISLKLSGGLTSSTGRLKIVEIDEAPFTLGRSPEASWPIEDDTRQASGLHFQLRLVGGQLMLTDMSSNGTSIGESGNRLQKSQPTPLGDETLVLLPSGSVLISKESSGLMDDPLVKGGDVELDDPFGTADFRRRPRSGGEGKLSLDHSDGADPPDISRALGSLGPLSLEPTAPGQAQQSSMREMRTRAEPTPTCKAPTKPPSENGMTETASREANSGGALAGRVDLEKEDPFSDFSPDDLSSGRASTSPRSLPHSFETPADPFDDGPAAHAAGGQTPGSLKPPASQRPPFEDPFDPSQPPDSAAAQSPPLVSPEADNGSETAYATMGATGDEAADAAALDALFVEIGVDPAKLSAEERRALSAEVGIVFVAMAEALRQLLATRDETKRALGIAGTELEIGANPLKVAVDPQDAARSVLVPLSSGFLHGERAVDDALAKMQTHNATVLEGVRLAIRRVMALLSPEEIEARGPAGWLERTVPAARKAALWDRYEETHKAASERHETDIRGLIGRDLDALYKSLKL